VIRPWLLPVATMFVSSLMAGQAPTPESQAVFAPQVAFALQAPAGADSQAATARALFKQAKFHEAAALYRTLLEKQPTAEFYAGLVQSQLKEDDVKAADESSLKALAALPQSAATHASRGEVFFRRGLMPEAETEFQTALKLDDKSARAWLGQGKIDAVLGRRTKAKAAVVKAHELDSDDGDALYEWAIRQPYPENVAALEKHLAEFHNDPEQEQHEREYIDFIKALAGRKVWIPARDIERSEIKLEQLTIGPTLTRRGYGLRVRLNDRATVTLLLDTGASGVIITRKLAEKIGARKLSDQALEGVGKSGGSAGYKAWVDKITIGDLEFHDCYIHATPHEIAQVDGTIGPDVFEKYLVTLDFHANKLLLEPLPASAETQTAVADTFSQAYSFGHLLLIPTQVEKKANGLFVLDSGANANTISPDLAKLVPAMRLFNSSVSGASGQANSAYIADSVTLSFAKAHRKNERISTVDLHSVSKDLGVELSGQISFAALDGMKVILNYRDSTVAVVPGR